MRTTRRRLRTATAAATVTAGLVLALTACGGSDGAAAKPGAGRSAAPDAAKGGDASAPAGTAGGASASGAGTQGASGTPVKSGAGTTGGNDKTGDAYAYSHPCAAKSLTVKVTSPQGFPASVRVVTVTNNGSASCGLDHHPTVGFSAKGAALGIEAAAPGGLGGAPAYPLRPGATAYAAVNLDPSGGTGPSADEISVLADAAHMANADGVSLPLAEPGTVAKPKVGLYRAGARESLGTL
ncbi:DUF4232 domain-containing protein [Streptomyces sp. NPDC006529]|uniref:DUF4232 domain-containing protein n=1 Tax=Streptomyces sp. NPDC006529 TaxID=3157177 RepID=UPI0033A3C97C